ncbi:putative Ig domain-containing protein [Bosea sp. (in: a-proteobacteria)]|uniref:putative Ig domain-containing protein n=1 Tax=Bosea sp. (in: a-proteobacteria) TaxID=1871050 RepID=UPI00273307C3|nr:putative Ig domain-containing protein [Bosea sp. (in: a-proteobacteria)]MDP3407393.1 putative Ig domain-containing protein [Bosea sp. (in: a-proteobacteria)]
MPAPTGLSLSNLAVIENSPFNTIVGLLAATDSDPGDGIARYELVTPGTPFSVFNNELRVVGPVDFELQPNWTLTIRAYDFSGNFVSADFTLSVADAIEGTANADTLNGTGGNDIIQGLAGNDTLTGQAGADLIDGGFGRDRVNYGNEAGSGPAIVNLSTAAIQYDADGAGPGAAVTVAAGTAIDTFGTVDTLVGIEDVRGTSLADYLVGGDEANLFHGRGGDDYMRGNGEADEFIGGSGNDTLDGTDVVNDGDPTDLVFAQFATGDPLASGVIVNFGDAAVTVGAEIVAGHTTRDAYASTDTLIDIEMARGTYNADHFFGGDTNNDDYEGFEGLAGNDVIDGGSGFDEVRYTNDAVYQNAAAVFGTQGVVVNLSTTARTVDLDGAGPAAPVTVAAGTARDGYGDTDTLTSIEGVRGTNAGDWIYGGDANERFRLFGGNDFVDGGAGIDQVDYRREWTGGNGVTVVLGGTATINGVGPGAARDSSGATDTLLNIEDIRGTDGADVIVGDHGANWLRGQGGGDNLTGNGGADILDGGGGIDRANYGNESGGIAGRGVIVNLSGTAITADIGNGPTLVAASSAIDTHGATDTLISIENVRGTGNADFIVGDGQSNTVFARGGADVVIGGGGNDFLYGGGGADILDGSVAGGDGFDVDTAFYQSDLTDTLSTGIHVNLSGAAVTLTDPVPGAGTITIAAHSAKDPLYTGATSEAVDTLIDIEAVRGTMLSDVLVGGDTQNDAYESFEGLGGDDYIDGGSGFDEVSYANGTSVGGTQGAIVNLSAADRVVGGVTVAAQTARDGFGGIDRLISIEGARGSSFADTLIGGDGNERFSGLAGADAIDGGSGNDTVSYLFDAAFGGTQGVQVNLGETVIGTLAAGTARDGFGSVDTLVSIENAHGTNFADTLIGSSAANAFNGFGGNDFISGGAFVQASVFTGDVNDRVFYSGSLADYAITRGQFGATYVVTDLRAGSPDGTDQISNIEYLHFADQILDLRQTYNSAPTGITVFSSQVQENVQGAFVTGLNVADPDFETVFSFSVSDIRFEVVNAGFYQLKLKAGVALDFEAEPTVSFDITATDHWGGSFTQALTLTVQNMNDAPVVAIPIPDQNATLGQPFSYIIPAGTFSDPEGNALQLFVQNLPGWMTYNPVTRELSGTPMPGAPNAIITVSANDGAGGQVSDSFSVSVAGAFNQFPVIVTPIPDQVARIGQPFSYTIPAGAYVDPEGQPLTINVMAPAAFWLSYDPAMRTISGTPPVGAGTVSVNVMISDGSGGMASDSFNLSVGFAGQDLPPTLQSEVLNQFVTVGQPFSYTIPANAYFDPEGQPLTISLVGQPAWLSFDPATRTISGTPPVDFLQASLAVSVSDGINPPVTDGFTVTRAGYLNQLPVVATPIPDQVARIGQPFSYTIPAGAYVDPESQPLNINVMAPSAFWLSYDPATRTISGTPPAGASTVFVDVMIADGFAGPASDRFTLSVGAVGQDLPPTLQSEILNQFVTVGQPFSYTIPANAYFDPEGQPLTLALIGQPAWLNFDPVTRTMSGTPPADFLQASLAVSVSDGINPPVIDGFTVQRAGYLNQFPVITAPIPDQVATIGQPFSYTIPAGAYVDPEGQPLTINVMAPTAVWLSYDPATRTISGTPPAGSSTVSLHVSVSDGFGGIASDFFNLSVGAGAPNQSPTAIALSGLTVAEGVPNAVVGTVTVTDADSTSFTFAVSDARFEVVGTPGAYVLRLAGANVLTAEQAANIALTVTATDGTGNSFAQGFGLTVLNTQIEGTNAGEFIVGDDTAQVINGLGGNDFLFGQGGDDTLNGGIDNDGLSGGAGNDTLIGEDGFDYAQYNLPADAGALTYAVGGDSATVFAGGVAVLAIQRVLGGGYTVQDLRPGSPLGTDTLASDVEAVFVFLDGPAGQPPAQVLTLNLVPRIDTGFVQGGIFGDLIDATTIPGVDAAQNIGIQGGEGDDVIIGHDGSNFITGGAGDDEISGGGGFDTASYALPTGTAGTLSSVTTGNITLVRLTDGAIVTDVFRVTSSGSAVTVEDLRPGSPLGTDTVYVGSGPVFQTELLNFQISGVGNAPPVQSLFLNIAPQGFTNAGGGFIQGSIGGDTISANVFFPLAGSADAISIDGGLGDDIISGHAGSNFITGGAGDDVISGGGGIDSAAFTLPLGTAGTLSSVTAGAVTLVKLTDGATTSDVFRITQTASGWTIEDLRPGSPLGTDTLDETIETLSVGIDGGPGLPPVQSLFLNLAPQFFPNGNGGFVQGGLGADVISVAALAPAAGVNDGVTVSGGAGDDVITGHGGPNALEGGGGNDVIGGGGGRDVAQYALPAGTTGFIGSVRDDNNVVRLTLNDNGSISDLFSIVRNGNGTWTVSDLRPGAPLGVDTLGADVEQVFVFVPSSPAAITINLVPLTETVSGVTSVFGSIEPDVLTASGSNNSQINLFGNLGHDTLTGHGGSNYLSGGVGNDIMDGAGGNDTLVGGGGADQINGGSGTDLVNYGDETGVSGVIVNLSGGSVTVGGTVFAARTARDSFGGTDTLSGIENVRGTIFADTLIGDDLENDLQGGGGADTLIGNGASDSFNGGGGNDIIDGTAVAGDSDDSDQVYYQGTNETVTGGVRVNLSATAITHLDGGVIAARSGQDTFGGVDTLIDIEMVRGTNFADVIYGGDAGNDAFEAFRGLGGVDHIDGGSGYDEARYDRDAQFGGTAGVVVNLSGSSRTVDRDGAGPQAPITIAAGTAIDGFGSVDTLVGIEGARGTAQSDIFIGGSEDNTFMGFAGADSFDGGGGTDTVRYDQEFNNGGAPVGIRANLSTTTQILGGIAVAAGSAIDSFGATDSLTSIEAIRGTRFDDIVHGGNAGETLRGDGGNDIFYGNGGIDTLRLNGNRADYSVTAIAPGRFEIVDLRAGSPDGIDTIYDVERLRFLDSTIDISVPEAAPTDIIATGPLSVQDTSGAGTTVATFGVVDAGDLGPHSYALVGGATDRFAIVGDRLVVAPGASFDAENEPVVSVTVRVTDPGGLSYDETFAITIGSRSLGGSGNDTLTGTGGADRLFGQGGNDILIGLDGDDTLNGGTGTDEMQGGAGNDSYVVDDAGDVASEDDGFGGDAGGLDKVTASVSFTLAQYIENLTLSGTADIDGTGNALDNRLLGNAGANVLDGGDGEDTLNGYGGSDTLRGGQGNDRLDGGTGVDAMFGGAGDDIYYVDDALDMASEDDGLGGDAGGLDLVIATASTVLSAHVEDLRLVGSDAIDGTGNDDDNSLLGNNAANRLIGLGGADVLTGYGGNDIIEGGEGDDVLTGGDGDDILRGGENDDVLKGGAGFDAMFGGSGDDLYYVDDLGDTASEDDGFGGDAGGFDTVYSTVSFALAAGIEVLRASGSGAISLTGNAGDNSLYGNAAANVIEGEAGNDLLSGGGGDDVLSGGDDDDRLLGGDGADQLFGDAGNDRLDGGAGADFMNGGAGDDIYYVNDVGDVISEDDGFGGDAGGFDIVYSSVDVTLGAGIENLYLTGSSAANGTGNGLDNRILGNSGDNVLSGGDGADQLVGNAGNDVLIGGAGTDNLNGGAGMDRLIGGLARDVLTGGADADTFVFEALPDTRDTITDFQTGLDRIEISSAAFGGGLTAGGSVNLVVNGTLAAGVAGFTYNSANGALAWDADGQGGAAAVAVAVLTNKPLLTASDFLLV